MRLDHGYEWYLPTGLVTRLANRVDVADLKVVDLTYLAGKIVSSDELLRLVGTYVELAERYACLLSARPGLRAHSGYRKAVERLGTELEVAYEEMRAAVMARLEAR